MLHRDRNGARLTYDDLGERFGASANTIDRFANGRAAPIPANLKATGVRFIESGRLERPKKGG
jgi:transcriptional regulator with XRE-family HTH domain